MTPREFAAKLDREGHHGQYIDSQYECLCDNPKPAPTPQPAIAPAVTTIRVAGQDVRVLNPEVLQPKAAAPKPVVTATPAPTVNNTAAPRSAPTPSTVVIAPRSTNTVNTATPGATTPATAVPRATAPTAPRSTNTVNTPTTGATTPGTAVPRGTTPVVTTPIANNPNPTIPVTPTSPNPIVSAPPTTIQNPVTNQPGNAVVIRPGGGGASPGNNASDPFVSTSTPTVDVPAENKTMLKAGGWILGLVAFGFLLTQFSGNNPKTVKATI